MSLVRVLQTVAQMIQDRGYPLDQLYQFVISDQFKDLDNPSAYLKKMIDQSIAKRGMSYKMMTPNSKYLEFINYLPDGNLRVVSKEDPPGSNKYKYLHVHFSRMASEAEEDRYPDLLKERTKFKPLPQKFKQTDQNTIQAFCNKIGAIHEVILITRTPIAPGVMRLINVQHQLRNFTHILYEKLSHARTLHRLYNKHEKLSKEEVRLLLDETGLQLSKFPVINISDPIVKHFGWQTGDLIRIERDDKFYPKIAPRSIQYRVVTADRR